MTALTFLPAVLLMMSGFTRIIIVLSLLRQAHRHAHRAAQSGADRAGVVPDFLRHGAGAWKTSIADAYQPFSQNRSALPTALDRAAVPLRQFMLKQTREADLGAVRQTRRMPNRPTSAEQIPMKVLIPAFVTSELKTAFQIGFLVFIPFLIIDMVVASVLMSMGMMMLSPVMISLPFKIMLFVLADGWNLLIGSLVQSFYEALP